MEYLKQVDWHVINTYRNSIFIINKDKPKEYVDYDQGSATAAYCRILERVADKKEMSFYLLKKKNKKAIYKRVY